jgi:tetratricopeptide (TPR) repeat protein
VHERTTHSRAHETTTFLILILLITSGIVRSAIATRLDSLDIDEPYHITSGVSYVRLGDYRLNPEHPPLVKLWVGMFLTPNVFQLPPLVQMTDKVGERHYTAGAVYLSNDPDRVQHRARLAMFLLNGLLLLSFGLALWNVTSPAVAVAAVGFLVIDPTVAAHWPVVLTDLPVALLSTTAFLLACRAFRTWRLRHLLICGLALGLALGAKHSAPVVVAAVVVLGMVMAFWQRATETGLRRKLSGVLLVTLLAWIVLWGLYRFRFNESPSGIDTFNRPLAAKIGDVNSPLIKKAVSFAADFHLLPRSYLWGFADVVRAGIEGRLYNIYFWNRYYVRTVPWYFFPTVIFFKLPLGLTALVGLGFALLVLRRLPDEWRFPLLAILCFAIFALAALISGRSGYAGIRHALPLLPPLAIFAGAGAVYAIRTNALKLFCTAAVLAALASALPVIRPWEYYNELAGGTAGAWRHFSDDGIENGQRVKEFANYYHKELEPKGILPYMEYWFFFNDEEFQRRGIRNINTAWDADESLDSSDVLSGTVVINSKWILPGPWSDYSSLLNAKPVARLGNLFVYQGSFNLGTARAWRIFFRAVGTLYGDKPDFEKAEQQFRAAATLAPNLLFANIELGNLLAKRGARAEAIQAYENARRCAPAGEAIGGLLADQIAQIKQKSPDSVPPVRDPYLE